MNPIHKARTSGPSRGKTCPTEITTKYRRNVASLLRRGGILSLPHTEHQSPKLLFQQFSPSSLTAIFFPYCLGQKLWTIQTTLLFLSHPTSNRSANYLQRSCLFSLPPLLFPPYLNHYVISYGSCVPSSCLSTHVL